MSTRKAKILYLFTTIVFILACAPAIALTPYPTTDPNEISTIIVLTANAASTQTAAAMPTATFTPSITPTRPTETPSPTETPTVIFILSTPTMMVVPTFTFIPSGGSGSGSGSGSGGSSSSSSDPFACQILSVSPANGTTMNKESDFDATWKVKNIGTRTWDQNSVDFIYLSGTEMNKRPGYDLSGNVKSGQQISLGTDMVSPKKSGTYTTTWALRVGDNEFCKMTLTINVK